ncbi:hypothetical protein like AT5G62770 [Hibiscus trionum]|uniref:Uncharacterized protein n=1 Tax=Hibiscus trionum TaxID=183268 RepID=A0A9W7IFB7_HIBTR|nr:hypothetical protein like AT5G62770 [Hibiscus trionum]
MQMQARSLISASPSSPSFSARSSGRLAEIAARVVEEFRQESGSQGDRSSLQKQLVQPEEEDDDFEFAFVCRDPEMSPVSADEIFYHGQIRPTYPVFNTKLLNNIDQTPNVDVSNSKPPRSHRLPLRELMSEERERISCSPSEADELDTVTPGTYCVWTPKAAATSAKIGSGSDSSGLSSKRWKLKDLLYTSNNDGGDKTCNAEAEAEQHCGCNRDMKAGDMRRSVLPNRQDLAGIFSSINGLSRSLHPF